MIQIGMAEVHSCFLSCQSSALAVSRFCRPCDFLASSFTSDNSGVIDDQLNRGRSTPIDAGPLEKLALPRHE